MIQGIKILAADDDKMSLEMLSTILSSQKDVLCTTVSNGRQAMETLESDPSFDIVLLDLQMPVMSGYEVITECKGNPYLVDIPIIVLAADHQEKLTALNLGADDFMSKPYNLEELDLRINKLVKFRRQTQVAQKAKKEFLAIASHELRTPMHQINGFAEILDGVALNANQQEFLHLLIKATSNLTAVVKNILDYVQLDEEIVNKHLEPYSLRATIQDAIDNHKVTANEKGIKLEFIIDSTVSDSLNGSSFYLYQIISILIENAVKFSSQGVISVAVQEESLEKNSSRFYCQVKDNGIGIPEEFHEQIFEPFIQVDSSNTRKFDGIGLGLAIAKRMVELMGGTISATNNSNSGSTFSFSLCSELQNV